MQSNELPDDTRKSLKNKNHSNITKVVDFPPVVIKIEDDDETQCNQVKEINKGKKKNENNVTVDRIEEKEKLYKGTEKYRNNINIMRNVKVQTDKFDIKSVSFFKY